MWCQGLGSSGPILLSCLPGVRAAICSTLSLWAQSGSVQGEVRVWMDLILHGSWGIALRALQILRWRTQEQLRGCPKVGMSFGVPKTSCFPWWFCQNMPPVGTYTCTIWWPTFSIVSQKGRILRGGCNVPIWYQMFPLLTDADGERGEWQQFFRGCFAF